MAKQPVKHRNGLIGTTVFHGILILLLLLLAFRTPLPLPEEEGILVEFGVTATGTGRIQPRMNDPATAQPQPSPANRAQQQNLTQDFEDAAAIPSAQTPSQTTREASATTQTTAPVEQTREPERTPDQRAMFRGAGDQSSTATSQGAAGGTGNQGAPTGAPNVHSYGDGINVGGGLAGRGIIGTMPKPSYDVQERGVVVVEVTVDSEGNVTNARAGVAGTTTSNATLRDAALRAARQTKFARNPNVVQQTGTITYNFVLR